MIKTNKCRLGKVLSFLLAVSMVLVLLPFGVAALADDEPELAVSELRIEHNGLCYSIGAVVSNTFDTPRTVNFITAIYDKNKLMDVQILSETIDADYDDRFDFEYMPEVELQPSYTIKVMAWDENQQPLCAPDLIPISNSNFAYLMAVGNYEWDDIRVRLFNKDGNEVVYKVDRKVKINNVKINNFDDALTPAQLTAIFGTPISGNEVSDLLNVTGYDTMHGDKVSAKMLLMALTGSKLDGVSYSFKPILKDTLASQTEDKANRIISYALNSSDVVTSINIPILNRESANKFAAVQRREDTETIWSEKNGSFTNMEPLADSAVIFVIPGDDPSNFAVISKAALRDETAVDSVYAYCRIKDQGPAIAMFTKDVVNIPGGFGIFSAYSKDMDGGNIISNIVYWSNGEKASNLVTYDADVVVDGCGIVNGDVSDMIPGDVFIYEVDYKNEVTKIHILFRAGTKAPSVPATDSYNSSIDIANKYGWSDDTFDNWDYYDVNTAGKPVKVENEVFFGIVTKVSGSNTRNIAVADRDGILDNAKTFVVSAVAPVTYYNPARTYSRRLDAAIVMDIMASTCLKDTNGDLILTTDASGEILKSIQNELTYVFVKLYKGEVEQIIYIVYNL